MRRALALALVLAVGAAPAALARTVLPGPHSKCSRAAKRKRHRRCHPPAPAPAPAARLGVAAREFSLALSRTSLPAGAALVELQNFGEDAHNLRIERLDGTGTPVDLPEAQAGKVTSAKATLGPGAYRLYCTLPGHDALGMHATLTVGG